MLQRLSTISPGTTVGTKEFLNAVFFRRDQGRALALNTHMQYAMFFINVKTAQDNSKKAEEVSKFLNLFSLLKYLADQGYLSFHSIEGGYERSAYYFQDSFFKSIPEGDQPVILNASGDYLATPETIVTTNKQPLYRGIAFEYETYALIAKTAISSFVLSKSLTELARGTLILTSWQSRSLLSIGLLTLTLIVVIGFHTSFYFEARNMESKIGELMESHRDIKNRLQQMNERVPNIGMQRESTNIDSSNQQVHYGIDVSKWNGNIKTDLNTDSLSFVICKATEGIGYLDPDFSVNWNLLKRRGLIRGAYHFFHVSDDPIKQAEFFLEAVKQFDPAEIPPIVDIEQQSLLSEGSSSPTKMQVALLLFLNHLERLTGKIPMIYTNGAFADQYLINDTFAKYPLWLAEYSNAQYPTVPLAWKDSGFKVWQKSANYSIQSKIVDLDLYFGKMEDIVK